MKLGLELPPTVPVLAPGKHGYVNFGFVRISDMYRIWIRVGFGYKCSQSVSKQKKMFFFIIFNSWYGPDTSMIWRAMSQTWERKEKGKKMENKEIWVEISTAKGRRRLLQVTAGPGSHPLVGSLLLLLCLSPHLFLSSPSSFSLFSTFSCFCHICLGSNSIMCIPNEPNTAIIKCPAVNYSQRVHLFISFLFPKKDSTIIISALNGYWKLNIKKQFKA